MPDSFFSFLRISPRAWLSSGKPMARIAQNLLWLMSGKSVAALLSIVYLAIATRTLGVAGFGQFALILSMGSAIALFAKFDCWQAVVRFGATHLHDGKKENLGQLVAACRIFDLIGIVIAGTLAVVVTLLLIRYADWDRQTAANALVYSLALLFAARSTPAGVLRLHDRFDLSIYAETVVPITRMAGTVAVLFVHPDITGFLIAWAGSELLAALVFWLLAARIDPDALSLRHSSHFLQTLRRERGLVRFLAVTNLGSTLNGITTQAPILMLGGFVSASAAGLFRLAFQLCQGLGKIATLLARTVYAELNHVRARGGHAALRKLLLQSNRVTNFAGVALIIVIALLGKWILWLIAGEAFIAAYPLLLLLGFAAAVNFAGISYEPALLASTTGKAALKINLAVAALLLGLLGLLLPLWGATGAAWAVVGAAIARFLLLRTATRKHVHEAEA